MAEITIKQETEDKKEPDESSIKEVLKDADEYAKVKAQNDRMEAEYLRGQELKAKMAVGGKAEAGEQVKERTQDDIDQEDADKLMANFK